MVFVLLYKTFRQDVELSLCYMSLCFKWIKTAGTKRSIGNIGNLAGSGSMARNACAQGRAV